MEQNETAQRLAAIEALLKEIRDAVVMPEADSLTRAVQEWREFMRTRPSPMVSP